MFGGFCTDGNGAVTKQHAYLGYARQCELVASRSIGDDRKILMEMAKAWGRVSMVEGDVEREAGRENGDSSNSLQRH